jgi:cyclic pyranopterin phosphate synthase
LRDLHGRQIDTLRLSVTDRCNLRCVYCMPDAGVPLVAHGELLSFEEIVRLAGVMTRTVGITKIRITGGEPLTRRGRPGLAGMLGELCPDLVLTTNGLLLPGLAEDLAAAGIRRVNVSLDSLRDEVLASVCRGAATVAGVERGIRAALDAGMSPVRVNCVIIPGVNEGEVPDLLLWGVETGVTVRFVEMMPATLDAAGGGFVEDILRRASVLGPVEEAEEGREAQRTWRIPSEGVTFGVIAPLSDPGFCSRCRRIRLSSTGGLVPCLGTGEAVDLRGPLRRGADDAELAGLVARAVGSKPPGHDGCRGVRIWMTGG